MTTTSEMKLKSLISKLDSNTIQLNVLRDLALSIAIDHGFTDASVAEDCALFHSEVSELLEDYRANHSPQDIWYESEIKETQLNSDGNEVKMIHTTIHKKFIDKYGRFNKPCGIRSEIADIIVRLLHFAGKHEIDVAEAIKEKMMYNSTRKFKHGNKRL